MSSHRSPRERLCGALALSLSILAAPGCGFLYENHGHGAGFRVYSDRSPQFVARVASDVRAIRRAYLDLFDVAPRELEEMTIALDGADDPFRVVDFDYAPEVLGYYLPGLAWISVDANPRWPEPERTLDQIVLHEVAHHFIVTLDPTASERCWLNEGLASNLETTLHDGAHFEYPLFHPVLYRSARRLAYSRREPVRVLDLIDKTWSDFHSADHKAENYALSWALVWYALERAQPRAVPLRERIRRVLQMERDDIAALEGGWNAFLRGYDVTRHLLAAAAADSSAARRLTAEWALAELAHGNGGDDVRALRGLAELFESVEPARRGVVGAAFIRRLEDTPSYALLEDDWLEDAVDSVDRFVGDPAQAAASRSEIVRAMARGFVYRTRWIPRLVELLEDPAPELRIAAAGSLASFVDKPTITNPGFWRAASGAARAREVAEWQRWWTAHLASR